MIDFFRWVGVEGRARASKSSIDVARHQVLGELHDLPDGLHHAWILRQLQLMTHPSAVIGAIRTADAIRAEYGWAA